jgi:predicted RNase H-like nuclease/RimJ/RimL family protein N-acetyltransferase
MQRLKSLRQQLLTQQATRMGREFWPFFQLRVRTPRVELRPPTDDDLFALVELADRGVHDPATMPFTIPWTDLPPPHRQRGALQFVWRSRAEWTPDHWRCIFIVETAGEIVGVQDVEAADFASMREVLTGSWLGMAYQGRGIGKEMRAAVLHFAFAGLGAEFALSGAFHDNVASRRVSESLGYEVVGQQRKLRRGRADWAIEYRMSRATWQANRRDDITIEGLDPCLELFGARTTARCAGVDGCRGGWVVATRDGCQVAPTLDQLVADTTIDVISVDMPIGLPRAWGRHCDDEARVRLGPKRSSLFDTPPRALLTEPTFEAANARSRVLFGRGISRQSYGLIPKINALDALVSQADEGRVIEVHPETSFTALAGCHLPPKSTVAGLDERRRLLEPIFGHIDDSVRGAGPADVFDAYAALWTAERFASGRHEVLGGDERDERGLVMRLVV